MWDLSDFGVQQPVVTNVTLAPSSGGYTATISGQNFNAAAFVTLWDEGGYFLMTVPGASVVSVTSTQIVAQLANLPVSSPSEVVLKIRNPEGPRSVGIQLADPVSTFSAALILQGQQAPGGGTFAGFSGFWSFNNRGEVIFSAGVDTNGDGTPDYFGDFELSAGQITKPTVPSFGPISSVSTHIRLNGQGDMAFGDVNGTYGGLPAGIYVLAAGNTTPTGVITWGQACPSPCPSVDPATIYQLNGPLAFGEAGDVAFTASLLNQQTKIATCCYLFLYTGSDGSIVKAAADGPTGDATPIGGTFSSGTFLSPITQITSDGDLIFLAQVTGGTSSGGIFRYSRTHGLSKVLAQGDPAPVPGGGAFGYPLFGREGSISGRQLVFHAPVVGGTSTQAIGLIRDVTLPSSVTLVAYQGESTGTGAGGLFSYPSGLPFGGYGENTAPPCIREDGAVVFHSLLVGSQAATGASAGEGLFLWNPRGLIQKIVVDGDPIGSGAIVQGVFASAVNDLGSVIYFSSSVK